MSHTPRSRAEAVARLHRQHSARVAERRSDARFSRLRGDARARTVAIGGELVVMKKGSNGADPMFRPDEARALAPTAESVFPAWPTRPAGPASRSIRKHERPERRPIFS